MNNKIINIIFLFIFLFGILYFLNYNSNKRKILLENFDNLDETIKSLFNGLEANKNHNPDTIHTHSHPILHTHNHFGGEKKSNKLVTSPVTTPVTPPTTKPVTTPVTPPVTSAVPGLPRVPPITDAGNNVHEIFTTDLSIDTKDKKCTKRTPSCPSVSPPPPPPPTSYETGCPATQPVVEKHIYSSCKKPLPNKEAHVKINLKDYVHKSNIPKPIDTSKYILKTQIPICPDMDNYIKKSEIPSCPILPDMSKYILKSSIPTPKQCPSFDKYVLKSSVPQQITCPTCPSCPECPSPCPDLNISCKKNDLETLKEKEREKHNNPKNIKNNIDMLSMGKIDKSVKSKECSLLNNHKIYKNGIYGPY